MPSAFYHDQMDFGLCPTTHNARVEGKPLEDMNKKKKSDQEQEEVWVSCPILRKNLKEKKEQRAIKSE
jgi:hypothetical protein